jgi:hypothetical protein
MIPAFLTFEVEPDRRRGYIAPVRWLVVVLLAIGLLTPSLMGAETRAKVIKVLVHRLDQSGRASLSPSLYERDAYQAYLTRNKAECSGLRFDVQWKAKAPRAARFLLRAEVITALGAAKKPVVLEKTVSAPRWRSGWSALILKGDEFRQAGEIIAWRVSLWEGERSVAQQESFLWQD